MSHESRLTIELRALLHSQRVAALGTINDDGTPSVSMVPFAVDPGDGLLVIHVSSLAAHTGNLKARPNVSLLVTQSEVKGEPVHALPRVTLDGTAMELEPNSQAWVTCRSVYLERFSEAEYMTTLGDFTFIAIAIFGARHVAGFGAARSVDAEGFLLVLKPFDDNPADGNVE